MYGSKSRWQLNTGGTPTMYRFIQCLAFISLFGIGVTEKFIKWGKEPCILIDIDATNMLEWIGQDGNITVADNFTFDGVDVTEGSCNPPNPNVGGLWVDGKRFEMVFYNNSGETNVQMNIYYNPQQVFRHNLTENVRNIVTFKAGSPGKAYSCRTPLSHVTKVHVGKEAYRYTLLISTIKIQGFDVIDGKFSAVEECPEDMTSSTHSTLSSSKHPTNHSTHSTHPSSHSTHPSSHSTHPSSHSTHPSSHSTHPSSHSTHPSSHSTHPSSHSTHPSSHSTHPSSHSTHPSSKHSTHSTLPTPTPLPTDHTKPMMQNFHTTCMRMVGEFQFNLSYPTDTPGENLTALFGVNDINVVSGQCGNSSTNVLFVTFYNNWQMNITVKRENSIVGNLVGGDKNVYWWSHMYLRYFYNGTSPDKTHWFPRVNGKYVNRTLEISKSLKKKTFQASNNGSYICNTQTTLDLGGGSSFTTWDLQYTAFQTGPNITFPSSGVTECAADTKSKGNLYIYVGVGLGVIVALVMTVYIAGRCCYRKNYEEM